MFLIITKWTPLVSDAKYINFFVLEEIYKNDNIDADGNSMISPTRYNKEVYEKWVNSVFTVRNLISVISEHTYDFLDSEDSNVIYTVQTFPDKSSYDMIELTDSYLYHQTVREEINQLLQINAEIKKFELDVDYSLLTDYSNVEALFQIY